MAILVHKGTVMHFDDFDLLETYAADNKTKVTSVELWGFEGVRIGQLYVRWANGAIAQFIGDSLSALRDYVGEVAGWPKPIIYPCPLPRSAGYLYAGVATEAEATAAPVEVEEEHAAKRVVRQRHSDVSETRRRRVRAEAV